MDYSLEIKILHISDCLCSLSGYLEQTVCQFFCVACEWALATFHGTCHHDCTTSIILVCSLYRPSAMYRYWFVYCIYTYSNCIIITFSGFALVYEYSNVDWLLNSAVLCCFYWLELFKVHWLIEFFEISQLKLILFLPVCWQKRHHDCHVYMLVQLQIATWLLWHCRCCPCCAVNS